jgi:exonuclease SbcC
MRPTNLRFGGIGAYPGHVEVDFDELSKKGLYLVVGPTGSGKTTIFDAMTYALYGKTASNREGMFVSDHENRVDPYVELSFSHQGRHFKVHREPPKEKSKNSVPHKQWFQEVDSHGSNLRTVTGATNVRSEVSALLGLDADQFMQVILLPQNKFQDFLMAKSTDRKPLLQKIFGTELYFRIALHLKEVATRLGEESDDIKVLLAQEHATKDTIVDSLSDQSYFHALQEIELPEIIEVLQIAHSDLTLENTQLNDAYSAAVTAETLATEDAERFDAAGEKAVLEEERKVAEPKVAQDKLKIENNERATRVGAAAQNLHILKNDEQSSRIQAQQLRDQFTESITKLTIAQEAKRSLVSALPTASAKALSTEVSSLLSKVTHVIKSSAELEELTAEISQIKDQNNARIKSIDESKALLEEIKKDLHKKKDALKEASSAAKKLPEFERKIEALDALHESADVQTKVEQLKRVSKAFEKAEKTFKDAETTLYKARVNRTLHLAGELASSLSAEEECPVCGSTNHPKKAAQTVEIDISAMEKKRDASFGKKQQAEQLLEDAQNELSDAKSAAKKLPSAIEEETLRKQFEELKAKTTLVEELEELIEDLDSELSDVQEQIKNDEIESKGEQTSLKQKLARQNVLAPIALSLGPITASQEAEATLTVAASLLDNIETSDLELGQNEARRVEAEKLLQSILKIEKFPSPEAAQASVLDDEEVQRLTQSINKYHALEVRIHILSGKVGATPAPKIRPSLDLLVENVLSAKEVLSKSTASMNKTKEAISVLRKTLGNINKLGPESAELVERADSALALARVVDKGAGSGDNQQLGLEEWVQRTLFEEVCHVATSQLQKLSNNRYILTLEAEGAKTKKYAGGLELYVLDSHSGKTRSVHTLSGGEQFLTSLALALALAEVVERHSGGMELSTLFIDEGFGSLDSHTLDSAMDVLMKLHDSGRTVGVITHVEAMQQQLPVGIRINKTNSGSTLEMSPH